VGTLTAAFELAEPGRANNRKALFRAEVYAENIVREAPGPDDDLVAQFATLTRAASGWLLQRHVDLPRLQCLDALCRLPLKPP
jgi:hypothetical protein